MGTGRGPMRESRAFVSNAYPVLYSVDRPASGIPGESRRPVTVSLGLLVRGIPSFLATIPVDEGEVEALLRSFSRGDVRVSAAGISVEGESGPEMIPGTREPWQAEEPIPTLPAAFLSLVCADGRRVAVARIVSREASASPQDIARFVIDQIARGVQIPDLASAS